MFTYLLRFFCLLQESISRGWWSGPVPYTLPVLRVTIFNLVMNSAAGRTSGMNDGLSLSNLETYYQLLRVTNALGYTYTLRSDGVTIHQEPLIPGEVSSDYLVVVASITIVCRWTALLGRLSASFLFFIIISLVAEKNISRDRLILYPHCLQRFMQYKNYKNY